eukprot:m.217760 g.217760  ORF g.217760 m.217760 type:complete len:129 (+) comp26251_c1_seq9:381-767(+)
MSARSQNPPHPTLQNNGEDSLYLCNTHSNSNNNSKKLQQQQPQQLATITRNNNHKESLKNKKLSLDVSIFIRTLQLGKSVANTLPNVISIQVDTADGGIFLQQVGKVSPCFRAHVIGVHVERPQSGIR